MDNIEKIVTETAVAKATTINVTCLTEQLGTGPGSMIVYDYTPSGGGVYAFISPNDLSSEGVKSALIVNAALFVIAYCFQPQFAYFFKIARVADAAEAASSASASGEPEA